jgi:hypothetical protein
MYYSYLLSITEDRQRLGIKNKQVYFVLCSICTNFVTLNF